MTPTIPVSSIISEFSLQLRKLLGNKLVKVILYGSYARGDYHENSDIDILVLTTMTEAEIREISNTVYDLAFELELQKGIHISIVIKNESQYEYWREVLPFYQNIKKEGLEIHAG